MSIKRFAISVLNRIKQPILSRFDTVTRIGVENELQRQWSRLQPGSVLDVGSATAPYRTKIPHTSYTTFDVDAVSGADMIGDLHHLPCDAESVDTVIATEVLEHLYHPHQAVSEIYRVLRPGGVCILSTRFIYKYHGVPKDYFRFTKDGLQYLFKDFTTVEVHHHGNRFQTLWQVLSGGKFSTFLLAPLNPLIAKIHTHETNWALGYVVYAIK